MITDRTQADVNEALRIRGKMQRGESLTPAEQSQYTNGLRGAYGPSDLNRVQDKVIELRSRLIANGVPVPPLQPPRESYWGVNKTFYAPDILTYLENVAILSGAYYVLPGTPQTPNMDDWIDYICANNIEKILVDIEVLLDGMISMFFYAAEISSGDLIGVI